MTIRSITNLYVQKLNGFLFTRIKQHFTIQVLTNNIYYKNKDLHIQSFSAIDLEAFG